MKLHRFFQSPPPFDPRRGSFRRAMRAAGGRRLSLRDKAGARALALRMCLCTIMSQGMCWGGERARLAFRMRTPPSRLPLSRADE